MLDESCWDTTDNRIGCHVFGHNGSGGYNGIVANRHPLQDGGIGADPNMLTQRNRGRTGDPPSFRW